MRHLHSITFALLALGACDEAPTAVRVHVQADATLGVTGLALSAGDTDPVTRVLAFSSDILVLVPDRWAGHPQPFAIDGTAASAVVARGAVDVVPRLGEEVSATVTLVSTACPEVCEVGSKRCHEQTVETCELVAGRCPGWSATELCQAPTPFCAAGACVAVCQDDCAAGTTTCDGVAGQRACGNYDADACLDWGPTTACAVNQVCAADACVPAAILTVAKVGSGDGAVRSVPDGIDCGTDCSEAYPAGTMVQLMAAPSAGATFGGWVGGGCAGTGGCTVTLAAATTVTARFDGPCADECAVGASACTSDSAERACGNYDADVCREWGPSVACDAGEQCLAGACVPVYDLSVSRSGTGTGTVTSNPVGITCGGDCTEAYAAGTTVQLAATPNANATFAGWSGGGCAGTGACTVTLAAATTVTARFDAVFTGQLAAGAENTCWLKPDHRVVCWGITLAVPAGTFDRISGGHNPHAYYCATRTSDHGLTCWGSAYSLPTGAFQDVDVGDYHACGLRVGGHVECWGTNGIGQPVAPPGPFLSVSAGHLHSCGVLSSGAVTCWGANFDAQSSPPAGTFLAVSAGDRHTCGIMTNGELRCWGANPYGVSTPPSGTFVQVASGSSHNCGIRSDGSLACWGRSDEGQVAPPAGAFVDVTVGTAHSCAIRTDGAVLCWGANWYDQSTPP